MVKVLAPLGFALLISFIAMGFIDMCNAILIQLT
jgi:hypothetical protein